MFTIDLILKNTPMPLSVQRKSDEDAQALYQEIMTAMRGNATVLELTCDRQTEKKVALLSSEIVAVQISQKSSTAATGRPPGFYALADG
ncbi:hypothetical protein H6F74_08390 [Trichocoleus sp. FACHB-90]|jgi:hypothetical protein|uniref:UPF0367 protein NDI37_23960 n=1 Tax=Funiculus sociatus GB2-A5 TaxID=2933946 RepID=A0ABV0JVT5_9CYAN|nr:MULTISPECIES: hypothetical protein [unclassified Trichocoleus]MBD1835071.1 hypothetical protein [Cyanobacteria bacterium FACHB-472]MBD1907281.1 hypothetical protein [Trichocoleus sp. FACHB-832]MBD1926267.1 hypothetical protein [Trichocoleus sp. FACHB-90]MBD1934600.1 hypothetical protein [Trichocoleus sp. FACHB-69]MBD2004380.1 hypothetical protein [Trichocoleus sp. FACHB-40]